MNQYSNAPSTDHSNTPSTPVDPLKHSFSQFMACLRGVTQNQTYTQWAVTFTWGAAAPTVTPRPIAPRTPSCLLPGSPLRSPSPPPECPCITQFL